MLVDENKKVTFEEFLKIDEKTEDQLEYIDGTIFNHPSPSTSHQSILTNISTEFGIYFKNKKGPCKHFIAPYDIFIDVNDSKNRVQPDISIICGKSGFTKNNYVGVPKLVVEILSPSTASVDYIQKMSLYMRAGVSEYWIVSPINKEIQAFKLINDVYEEPISYNGDQILYSYVFKDLKIDLKEIFE